MAKRFQSKARRDAQRKLERERDLRELGDMQSSCGNGTMKVDGFRKPQPNRFRKHGQSSPPAKGLSVRELADQMYREDHGSG